jgi:hypothetical protein
MISLDIIFASLIIFLIADDIISPKPQRSRTATRVSPNAIVEHLSIVLSRERYRFIYYRDAADKTYLLI